VPFTIGSALLTGLVGWLGMRRHLKVA